MIWNDIIVLVEQAKFGDRDAYGKLFRLFRNSVFATALKQVHNDVEAEELTQDVFVHGWRKLVQLREPRAFGGWLKRITVRLAINQRKRKGLIGGGDPELIDNLPGRVDGPLDELERTEAKGYVHAGLQQLKPLDRDTLEAFYLRKRSLKQMSQDFNTPVGTIKRRLHVARQRLRDVLTGNFPCFQEERDDCREMSKRELATAV
jgi:RNA polymerase sigma-70 factor, ECF subfamily